MMEDPRYAFSEMHFGIFPGPDDFQCWKVNIKSEAWVSTSYLQLIFSWIHEVEMAGSIDDLTM